MKDYMEIKTDYQLDCTIDRYYQLLKKKKVFNIYPKLEEQFTLYKELLKDSSTLIDRECNDFFEIPITTGSEDDYYYLNWSVDLIDKYVNENINSAKGIPIGDPNIFSCDSRLNTQKFEYFKTIDKIEKPIVLSFHLPIRKWLVIDGNHRFHVAKYRNDKSIKAILLYPNTHWQFLVNDICRKQYIIHHNLHIIINLCHYPLRFLLKSSKNLDMNSYYPLDEDLNFSFIKNIRLYFQQIMKTN